MKRLLIGVVVSLVALAAGWVWGSWGRWEAERTLHASELRRELVEARGAVLDARLAIYNVNFGNATQHLEAARTVIHSAQNRLQAAGRDEDVERLDRVLSRIDEARRTAGNLDQAANTHAATAASAISELLKSLPLP